MPLPQKFAKSEATPDYSMLRTNLCMFGTCLVGPEQSASPCPDAG